VYDSSNVTIFDNWFTTPSPPGFSVGPGILIEACMDIQLTNNVFEQVDRCIEIQNSEHITISRNSLQDYWEGVSIASSSDVRVSYNEFWGQDVAFGVSVSSSPETEITNNVIAHYGKGIEAYESDCYIYNNSIQMTQVVYGVNVIDVSGSNCQIVENVISGGTNGIYAEASSNISIERNLVYADTYGIYLRSCMNMTLLDNEFVECGLFIYGILEEMYQNLIGNTVNSKPLGYFTNIESETIDLSTFGQAILVNCTNTIFENGNFGDASRAIQLAYSTDCEIRSTIIDGSYVGIYLLSSNDNVVRDNFLQNCDFGIYLPSTGGCTIENNDLVGGMHGIYLNYNYDTLVQNNRFNESMNSGINIRFSQNITFVNNIFEKTGVLFTGDTVEQWTHTFESNFVNGLPLEYILSEQDLYLSGSYGQMIIVDSVNVTVDSTFFADTTTGIIAGFSEDLNIYNVGVYNCSYDAVSFYQCHNSTIQSSSFVRNGEDGIYLIFCTNFYVSGNEVSENHRGIALASTQYSTICNNTILSNLNYGITLYSGSEFNSLYYNIIGYNGMNAEDIDSNNVWDDSVSLGNYWSDWYSPTEYNVISTIDRYPQPFLSLTNPGYYEFYEDDTDIWIKWIVGGLTPLNYYVDRDGTFVTSGIWTGGDILVNIDGLVQGTYYYTIHISMLDGSTVSSTNTVVVLPSGGVPEPVVIGPDDFTIDQVEYAEIIWELYDEHAIAYEIWVDGIFHTSNLWSGPSLTVTHAIQLLNPGIYEYTILVIGEGGNATDTVYVTVNQIYEYPEVIFPDDITYTEGELGIDLTFILYHEDPSYWCTYIDGGYNYELVEWTQPNETFIVNVDGLSVGIHQLVFSATGSEFFNTTGIVTITVLEQTGYPEIIFPDDIVYTEGETGNDLFFMLYDENPVWWATELDGAFYTSGPWTEPNLNVTVNVDGFAVGTHELFFAAWGTLNGTGTVYITVESSTPISIYGPDYISFNEGELGWTIDWDIYGEAPGYYWVYQNGDVLFGGDWDYSGYRVSVILDGLPAGNYVFSLDVGDSLGSQMMFTTVVDVLGQGQGVEIYGPDYISFNEGELGWTIDWEIYGTAPGHYWVYQNGELLFEGDWDYSGYIVTVDLDGVPLGNYIYQISVEDASYTSGWFDTFVDITSPFPMVIGPEEPIYLTYRDTGYSIVWEIYEINPLHYEVERYQWGISRETVIWETWWENTTVVVSLDGLSPGDYWFRIEAVGLYNTAIGEVEVHIVGTFPAPSIQGPENYSFIDGETGNSLTYLLYDEYPFQYYVSVVGYDILLQEWYEQELNITVDLDGLGVGEYLVRILAMNEMGLQTEWVTIVTVSPQPGYIPHDPIWIESNSDFEYYANLEGWQGSGSEADPFVIEDYAIVSSYICLYIGNTDYHYRIRNCIFSPSSEGSYSTGVVINSAPNGIIENCRFFVTHALEINNSDGIVVVNNEFQGGSSEYGVTIGYSQYVVVDNNTFVNYYGSLHIMGCYQSEITNNVFSNCMLGIMLMSSSECVVSGNTFDSGGIHIDGWTEDYWHNTFSENYLMGKPIGFFFDLTGVNVDVSEYAQLFVFNCTDSEFYNGHFKGSAYGVIMALSHYCTLSDVVLEDLAGMIVDRSDNCLFQNITSIDGSGFYARMCQDLVFSNCVVIDSYTAFQFYETESVLITESTIANCEVGIAPHHCTNTIITNTSFIGNGIAINDVYNIGTAVYNSVFEGSAQYAIYVSQSENCTFSHNAFYNNYYGIYINWYSMNCYVFKNQFFSSLKMHAYDYGPYPSNFWDDGFSQGNIWDDYDGTGWYYIDGHGLGIDHYPATTIVQTPPTTSSPDDITIMEGDDSQSFSWFVDDDNRDHYEIWINGELIAYEDWLVGDIALGNELIDLLPGVYTYTLILFDMDGLNTTDSVIVTVLPDITPPEIQYYWGTSYIHGELDNFIVWGIYDDNPLYYELYVDGMYIDTFAWTEQFVEVSFNVDGLDVGDHQFELIAYALGGNVSAIVGVYVLPDTIPFVSNPSDVSYSYGSVGNTITWTAADPYLEYYEIMIDGNYYEVGPLSYPVDTIVVNIDGLDIGSYEFTITVSNLGFNATDTVFVTVNPNNPPGFLMPTDLIMLEGTSDRTILWTVYAVSQIIGYEIYLDGILQISQPWSDPEISIQVDTHPIGTYEYTLIIIGYGVNATDTVMVHVVEEFAGTILIDYSHGQYTDSRYERYDIPLFNGLMALGYNVQFAFDGLTPSVLDGADALIFGSTYYGVVTYDEWLAVQTWWNSGDRFIWVAGDADYPNYEINGNSTYLLEAIGSNLYTEWTSVEDLESNVADAVYRVIANTTSTDPFVSEIIDGVSSVFFHGPTCVYGTMTSTPWMDFVRLESASMDYVYPLLYFGGTSYIHDLDEYPPLVYTDGEFGPFVAAALQIYAGTTGGGRILVSGASPYGDYMPMCGQEYYDVQFDGLRFVIQAIDFAMRFNETLPTEPPTTSSPDDITFLEGDDSQILSWFVDDDNREHYEIWLNGELIAYEAWLIGDDRLDLELIDLLPGIYTYTLILFDMDGLNTTDSVVITVNPDETPPVFYYYWGTWFHQGELNNSIVWGIYDDNPLYYELYVDGIYIATYDWTEPFMEVNYNVDYLDVGEYQFELIAYGIGGNTSAWVDAYVLPGTIPVVSSPLDITFSYGSSGNTISWTATDPYLEYYDISMDGLFYDWGLFDSTFEVVTINVDGLDVGVHEFTITVSNLGFNATDTVIVRVLEGDIPEHVDSYLSDDKGTVLTYFDVVFRKVNDAYKLVTTRPSNMFYNIEFTNIWNYTLHDVSFNIVIPSDFVLKGTNPTQVFLDGVEISQFADINGTLIIIYNINSGSNVSIRIEVDYALKGTFYDEFDDFDIQGYWFEVTTSEIGANTLTSDSSKSSIFSNLKKETSIAGYVTDILGNPLADVPVELYDDKGDRVASTITDDDGFYYFVDIRKGSYSVVIIYEDVEYEQDAVAEKDMMTLIFFVIENE